MAELSQQQRAWLEGEAHDVAQICQHMQWERKSAKDQILATFRIGEEEWHGQVDEHQDEIEGIVCSALNEFYGIEVQDK